MTQTKKQICKKLAKNKSIEEIADDLEEDVSTIEKIYNVAGEFAPEYDIDSIMEVLEKEQQKVQVLNSQTQAL